MKRVFFTLRPGAKSLSRCLSTVDEIAYLGLEEGFLHSEARCHVAVQVPDHCLRFEIVEMQVCE